MRSDFLRLKCEFSKQHQVTTRVLKRLSGMMMLTASETKTAKEESWRNCRKTDK